MSDLVLRDGRPEDAAGLLAIRNHAIAHTTAVWSDDPIDEAAHAEWLAELLNRDALIVANEVSQGGTSAGGTSAGDQSAVAGYASFFPWRPKEGYRYTVENSVYVREGFQGRGLGRDLLAAIVERARESGAHVMMAAIEAQNTGSIRVHERLGFVNVGTIAEVGWKFGRWLDLTHLRLQLSESDARPPG